MGISDRRGVDEQEIREDDGVDPEVEEGYPLTTELAPPSVLASRLTFTGATTAATGGCNEPRAAAAQGPLLGIGWPIPRRALRSSRDRPEPGRTPRVFDREFLGAIAPEGCSDNKTSVCECGCVGESWELEPRAMMGYIRTTNIPNGKDPQKQNRSRARRKAPTCLRPPVP
jgi:hypothetical protein